MKSTTIKLNEAESLLCHEIFPDGRFQRIERNGLEKLEALSRSLIHRKAIPQIRLDYFLKPELNIKRKISHKDVFEKNGTKGDAILRHPISPHICIILFLAHH
jgi:hypothetical protein